MKVSKAVNLTLAFFTIAVLVGCEQRPRPVSTPDAPQPVGPYSQAEIAGHFVFGAELGIDPKQGKIVATTAEGQMSQAMDNVFAVLKAAGSDPSKLVKVTVYFKNLDDYDKANAVYARVLGNNRPARAAVQVDRIPLDALIEIDFIAQR